MVVSENEDGGENGDDSDIGLQMSNKEKNQMVLSISAASNNDIKVS